MNIKVCGITEMKQLQQLDGLDIDFAGLIFYKESPRYIGEKISKSELKKADFDLKKVGVFVNPEMIDVLDAIDDYGLDAVQLHGDESPEMCDDLSSEVEVIKAFRVTDGLDIDKMVAPYDAVCDYYLFDTGGLKESFGGTGKQFDWTILTKAKIEKPFFLSGGIRPEDAVKVKGFKHPDFFGVDINSQFEKEPGVKDMGKVLQFRQGLK
ncbi:MAG: phosphoribosylanthranilate isomerase [Chitinophagaceae bacterium]|jgi:phosphoribosylanthranilate isomerase|nr:phosphoribosylanthranilate isomerase [Chitinophagaceae bacterium]MBK7680389.1 phosphoribosylanthranilate isomerase [Chitinophagaceae bacterium]MBK8301820.1 phosphoribosylanthranilate isomerase [Chitinophagaceae bacterium]MBK9465845.1 phosphoribosylanthranilate isomerase [Chitinophagaceae bacterium]MBK9661114.1 phosphoribosylanthranilate isomerase [Chitinophagaceae bacterium]